MLSKKTLILTSIFLFTAVCVLADDLDLGASNSTVLQLQELKLGMAESAIKNSKLFSSMWTDRQFEDPHIYECKVKDKNNATYFAACRGKKCTDINISFSDYIESKEALALAQSTFPCNSGHCLEKEEPDFQTENKSVPVCQYFYWKDCACELTYFTGTRKVSKIHCWIRIKQK